MLVQNRSWNPGHTLKVFDIGEGDQLEDIFQAHLIGHIDGGMLDPSLLIRILPYQAAVQFRQIRDTMAVAHIVDEDEEKAASGLGIKVGHVMVFQGNLEAFGQSSKAMALVFWIEISGKLKGINNWLANHRQAMALIVGIHKAYVKAGIVGNQDGILAEGLKFLQDLQEGF